MVSKAKLLFMGKSLKRENRGERQARNLKLFWGQKHLQPQTIKQRFLKMYTLDWTLGWIIPSLCHRNPLELCGWHLVWGKVSMCDVRGHPQPPVLLHQHDHPLPGAWHHIHVSYPLYFLPNMRTERPDVNRTDPVTRLQSKWVVIEASASSDVFRLKVKQISALLYSRTFDCWTVCSISIMHMY